MKPVLQKPKLLFFPMDMLSHQLRCLQLADAVKDVADSVFATEKYMELIQSRGHEAVFCEALDAEVIVAKGQQGDSSWMSVKNMEPILARQIAAIQKINPDYVINDYSFVAQMAAEFTNKPCISLINGLFSKNLAVARGVPPSHPAAKFSFLMPGFLIQLIQSKIFQGLHKPFRQLRKVYGLSQTRKMFLQEFEADYNLILDSLEFAPQTHFSDNAVFLGPLYHTDSKSEVQLLSKLDPKKKTILVNMGSGGQNEKVQYLNDPAFSKYNIIVTGNRTECFTAHHLIKAGFVSLENVLPHVDLVLNQGGTGNIFQTVAHGVPMFCYPTFFEQEWNALRIDEIGYGLCLTGKEKINKVEELIATWIEKKSSLKFKSLKSGDNVETSKIRFRQFLLNVLPESKNAVQVQVEKRRGISQPGYTS